MRAIMNGAATGDPTRSVIEAVKRTLADLDDRPVGDLTDDVEMAEMVGRLKALVGVLVTVVDD